MKAINLEISNDYVSRLCGLKYFLDSGLYDAVDNNDCCDINHIDGDTDRE